MSKMLKNALIIFTLVCLVVVVVFSAELVLLNREDDDAAKAESPPSETPGAAVSDPLTSSPPPTDSAPPTDAELQEEPSGGEEPPESPAHSPGHTLFTLAMTEDISLELYANELLFDYEMMDIGDMFTYKGGGLATLEILLDYIPHGAARRAVGFLDGYTGGAESTIVYDSQVGKSDITGVYVTAISNDNTYAAWICDIPDAGEALGILLIIHYRDENQKSALYEILDTVKIVPAEISEDVETPAVDE